MWVHDCWYDFIMWKMEFFYAVVLLWEQIFHLHQMEVPSAYHKWQIFVIFYIVHEDYLLWRWLAWRWINPFIIRQAHWWQMSDNGGGGNYHKKAEQGGTYHWPSAKIAEGSKKEIFDKHFYVWPVKSITLPWE